MQNEEATKGVARIRRLPIGYEDKASLIRTNALACGLYGCEAADLNDAAMRELQDENKALREALERARATIAAQGDPDSDSSDSDYDPDDLASMDETLKNKTTL